MSNARLTFFAIIGLALTCALSTHALSRGTSHSPGAGPERTGAGVERAEAQPDESAAVTTLAAPDLPPLTVDERAVVAWAHSRFSLAGLVLPDVEISFHDQTDPCRQHDGIYISDGDGSRIRVCVPDRGTFASTLQRRRTLVHELAHAWEQANLDDEQRAELLPTLEAEDWYAPESAWDQRGAERLAETIVWGLYDQLRRPTLIDVPCRELHADFEAITGKTAFGPLEPRCELAAAQSVESHTNGSGPSTNHETNRRSEQ